MNAVLNDHWFPPERPKILIVDDRVENLYVLEKLLSRLDVEVFRAQSGPEALAFTMDHEFCMAIVDIQMPEMDGYELVEMLRSNLTTASLPVIFVSAIYSDEYHHRKAYEEGAVDFLSKPFIPEILLSKVKVFLVLYQQRQALAMANEELKQANAALYQASADKDKFFNIISHDLRSPFNSILGFTELLELQAPALKGTEVQEMARIIHAGARTAYALLDNLLTWARLQRDKGMTTNAKNINLKTLVKTSLEVFQQTAFVKNIALIDAIDENVQICADERMIDTVLRNLIGNGIKFTPRGGSITVLQDKAQIKNGKATIGVRDTGIGMSQEVQAKLFRIDVHHSTPGTEQEPGSGLGLIICREFVERHRGKIWVESEAGKGTTIWFCLPSNQEHVSPVLPSQPEENSKSGDAQ